jgi:hypothetical protein
MSAANLRTTDWEHRLHVLWAWRKRRHVTHGGRDEVAINCAVKDGCGVTLRAICGLIGVKCNFSKKSLSSGPGRTLELLNCCTTGRHFVTKLRPEDQRCLLEVLYLGNRAIAHPDDGHVDHKVGVHEMTAAINVVLNWLEEKALLWPELKKVPEELLEPIK